MARSCGGRTPTLHVRALRLRLAETVRANGLVRPGEALRVATWLEEADAPIDERLLLAAAREANAAGDPDVAANLAQRALDGGAGGTEAVLILAHADVLRRRFAEAEDLLAGLEDGALTGELAVGYLEERALRVLHLGLLDSDEALGVLARAEGWSADAGWRDRVDLIRSQILLTSPGTGPAEAADALNRLLQHAELIPEVRRRASILYALALYQLGRTADARAVSERLRPSVPLRDADDAWALMAWWAPRHVAGCEWADTERWLLDADRASARANDPLTRGELAVLIASSAMRRGKPITATKRAREAVEILQRSDTAHRLPIAWSCLVVATSACGDMDAARAAMAGYWRSVRRLLVPGRPAPGDHRAGGAGGRRRRDEPCRGDAPGCRRQERGQPARPGPPAPRCTASWRGATDRRTPVAGRRCRLRRTAGRELRRHRDSAGRERRRGPCWGSAGPG